MNIVSLHTFLAIVDTGSLVQASHKMNVTQSTVTARLKALEEEIGQVLLNRHKSGATLTPAGTKLLRHARIMTGIWRQAKFETGLPDGLDAVCSFGCDRELWHGPGRKFFYSVNKKHPEIAISVQQGGARDLEEWLTSGMVDVILTYEAVARGAQTIVDLPPEELILYSDRQFSPVTGDPAYIFVDHGSDFRRQHAEAYHTAGVARISFDSSWWALQYMLDASGSAYLPRALASRFVQSGRIFPVENAPVFSRKKCLVVNENTAKNWGWFAGVLEKLLNEDTDVLETST